jgi:hypothetical protein
MVPPGVVSTDDATAVDVNAREARDPRLRYTLLVQYADPKRHHDPLTSAAR